MWGLDVEPNLEFRAAVQAVADVMDQVSESQRRLDEAVAVARAAGATWGQIGAAAGMTRQSAHQRWGHLSEPDCPRAGCGCAEHQPGRGFCGCGHGPSRGAGRGRPALSGP